MKRNLEIMRIQEKNVVVREMTTLEIYGALAMLTQLLQEWYEAMGCDYQVSSTKVDGDTYYCNKHLHIQDGYILTDDESDIVLRNVFCIENNTHDLFGYAEILNEDGEVQDVLVRI